jgi:hypothetical protein
MLLRALPSLVVVVLLLMCCFNKVNLSAILLVHKRILLLLLLLLLTAIGLSHSGSGYFACIQNMKLVTNKFKSGGLHEKHVEAMIHCGLCGQQHNTVDR